MDPLSADDLWWAPSVDRGVRRDPSSRDDDLDLTGTDALMEIIGELAGLSAGADAGGPVLGAAPDPAPRMPVSGPVRVSRPEERPPQVGAPQTWLPQNGLPIESPVHVPQRSFPSPQVARLDDRAAVLPLPQPVGPSAAPQKRARPEKPPQGRAETRRARSGSLASRRPIRRPEVSLGRAPIATRVLDLPFLELLRAADRSVRQWLPRTRLPAELAPEHVVWLVLLGVGALLALLL